MNEPAGRGAGQTIDMSQFAGEWALDGARSSVSFRSSSLWGLMKVKGTFRGLRGEGHLDPSGSVRGHLVIETSSVDTGNKRRDRHLRADDFFAVSKHPQIVFELNLLVPGPDQSRLSGTLRILGISQPLDLVAAIRDRDPSGLTLHAETTAGEASYLRPPGGTAGQRSRRAGKETTSGPHRERPQSYPRARSLIDGRRRD
jgi:polyisoprenoid-binding protein YceI